MDIIIHWILRLGWLLGAWLFAVGAAVGSFLNVVVYRVPAGKSLVYPGSRCPACGHPIRWYHNIPVLSWLLLRGKCHDCGAAISARYPLVELTMGLVFVGLAAIELWPPARKAAGVPAFLPHAAGSDILARYCLHLWLLATLLAAALIERDGQTVNRRIAWLGATVGLAVSAAWPAVQPRFDYVLPPAWQIGDRWPALAASAAGGVVGLMAGWIFRLVGASPSKSLAPMRVQNRSAETGRPDAWTLACTGTILGWQGAVLTGLAATILWLAIDTRAPRKAKRRWGWTAVLLIAAVGWIVLTRNWFDRPAGWMPSDMQLNGMPLNGR